MDTGLAAASANQTSVGLVPNYALITIIAVVAIIIVLMIIAVVLVGTGKMSVETWKEQSLGIPKGSIRALLALIFCFVAIGVWITTKNMPEWLIGILGAIVGFYFGSKA